MLQALENKTQTGLQEIFTTAFEGYRTAVRAEQAKVRMEVEDRAAKRQRSPVDTDDTEADLANRNVPPTSDLPNPSLPPPSAAAVPASSNASASTNSGGAPLLPSTPKKPAGKQAPETPEEKQVRVRAAAVEALRAASEARGAKAHDPNQQTKNGEDADDL